MGTLGSRSPSGSPSPTTRSRSPLQPRLIDASSPPELLDELSSPAHFHEKRHEALRFEKLARELNEAKQQVARGRKREDMLATELRSLQKKAASENRQCEATEQGLRKALHEAEQGKVSRSQALAGRGDERELGFLRQDYPELKAMLRHARLPPGTSGIMQQEVPRDPAMLGHELERHMARLERERERLQGELEVEREAHRKTNARYEAQMRGCVCRI